MSAGAQQAMAVEVDHDTVIVTPAKNMGQFDRGALEAETAAIVEQIDAIPIGNVVLDLGQMDFISSVCLGMFVTMWKKVRERDAYMAVCGASELARQILESATFDKLWAICPSRAAALETVRKGG